MSELVDARFSAAVSQHLVPMLGATASPPSASPERMYKTASLVSGGTQLKVARKSGETNSVVLSRAQKFQPSEVRLARAFVNAFNAIAAPHLATDVQQLLDRTIPELTLVRFFEEPVLAELLDVASELSTQTYEGGRISLAIGVEPTEQGEVAGAQFWPADFSKVFSNGFDTIIGVDRDGRVTAPTPLDDPPSEKPGYAETLAPVRLGRICHWSKGNSESGPRVAIVLNRLGEVLVLKDWELVFAKRRGTWRHFLHEPIVSGMGVPRDKTLRAAIYRSCLDVSFARTGGCVAVVAHGSQSKLRAGLVAPRDLLEHEDSKEWPRANYVRQLAQRPFQELDRRIRAEMLAMDGAVVLGHDGIVLAAGAIVRVEGGSDGGGRRAAAVALSDLGIAMKISADGAVTGFKGKEELWEFG